MTTNYKIPLKNRKGDIVDYSYVDQDIYKIASKYRWYKRDYKNKFGVTSYALGYINGKHTTLHKFILGEPPNTLVIDHVDNNGLNNQIRNLRFVTRSQNSQNKVSKNKFKGVSLNKTTQKWTARYKTRYLGTFDNDELAARKYDQVVIQANNGIAKTNFVYSKAEIQEIINLGMQLKEKCVPKHIHYHKQNGKYYAIKILNNKTYRSKGCSSLEEALLLVPELLNLVDSLKPKKNNNECNIIRNNDGVAIIPLNNKAINTVEECLVDDTHWHNLIQYKWYKQPNGYISGYVKGKTIRMHRYIMNANDGDIIDHINRIRHDNRFENLRLSTSVKNSHNRNPKHQYKGVRYNNKSWVALITKNGITYNVGSYDDPVKAALAYNIKAQILYQDDANLNPISDNDQNRFFDEVKSRMRIKKTSRYKGVCFSTRSKLWIAAISKNNKKYHIGYFNDEKSAALAYNDKAFDLYGTDYKFFNII